MRRGMMTREDVISNVLANYGKYGIKRKTVEKLLDSGLKEGLSYQAIYTGIKLACAQEYGEHTLFSTAEVAEVLGVSEEMVIQEIEKAKVELLESGENPDDYFPEVKPEKCRRFIMPPGYLND